ncbi:hypothetical protein HMPREF9123_2056 [Neisseria bacilliformis ATCC BAA-1200]|uniref:Uncharacterized protein n=1 Tax=Neisseria bacilliformis ATCC BAA-1200 TaxID=888742 RepID=F2BEA0_9NEIS|nr:hypothetical protein HMPREF9123_2056 [Neisseria bacilliformis ATCC BAA-1200]
MAAPKLRFQTAFRFSKRLKPPPRRNRVHGLRHTHYFNGRGRLKTNQAYAAGGIRRVCRPEAAHAVWPSEKPYCAGLCCAEAVFSDCLSFF